MNTQSEIRSFYIPRVKIGTTEKHVEFVFKMSGIGMPSRVDFVSCDYKMFPYKSAFVHFDSFYDSVDSVISFEELHAGIFQRIGLEPYWRILKNRNPVSSFQQIEAKCCALEEKVHKLESDNKYLLDTIDMVVHRRISAVERNLYSLADFVFDKVVPENMPNNESDGPTPEEIASAYEVDSEEDKVEEDTQIQWLEQVTQHIDASWLEQAIQKVEERKNEIDARRERIMFTNTLCGNE